MSKHPQPTFCFRLARSLEGSTPRQPLHRSRMSNSNRKPTAHKTLKQILSSELAKTLGCAALELVGLLMITKCDAEGLAGEQWRTICCWLRGLLG